MFFLEKKIVKIMLIIQSNYKIIYTKSLFHPMSYSDSIPDHVKSSIKTLAHKLHFYTRRKWKIYESLNQDKLKVRNKLFEWLVPLVLRGECDMIWLRKYEIQL